jgi:hypothetical protein
MQDVLEKIDNLPSDKKAIVTKIALQEAYKESLYHFAHNLLGYSDIQWNTHRGIIELLESNRDRKLICIPRGCFKSSLCTIAYPLWRLMRDPGLRILIDSEVYSNSKNFLREIKQHAVSPKFTRIFGKTKGSLWNEGEIVIAQRDIIKREASITCGGISTTKVGQHYDLIVGDDYNSNQNSGTVDGRKKVVQHYKYNLSILEQKGEYALIGTRYAMDDLIGWVIENEVGIKDFSERKDFTNNNFTKKNGVFNG